MRKKFLFIFYYIFISMITINYGHAYDNDPKKFITEIVDEAKKILIAGNDKAYKEKKLTEIALKTVDVKGIGFYTLGKYRKSLTDEQLKTLQEIVGAMNGATTRVGQIETQKHAVLHDLTLMRKDLVDFQAELEKEYGKVNVNIQDGTISEREDVEANTED